MNKFIECPNCKCQYAIQEIYHPDYLLGRPKNIIRDENGQVELFEGTEQDLVEEYTCDKCNTTFKIKADIKFETEILSTKSYDDSYVSKIYKDRINLTEN